MEDSDINALSAAASDADATLPPTDNSVSIHNLFQEETDSKKVIVLQTPDLAMSDAKTNELPNLMDAIDPSHEMSLDQNQQLSGENQLTSTDSDINIQGMTAVQFLNESALHVSMNNETDKVINETVFVDENLACENVDDNDTKDLLLLQPHDMKENIQFIDISGTGGTSDVVEDPGIQSETHNSSIESHFESQQIRLPVNRRSKPPNNSLSKDDNTRTTKFLCPVCAKSFRQKHLLLCHLKLHKTKQARNSSVYMSNCTSCGGTVRLTDEQARLLQERGTQDARIICSTCKLLAQDLTQQQVPKPPSSYKCDVCLCNINLTEDQLQLVEKKGADNIRIICAPCSVKDQEPAETQPNREATNEDLKCNMCHRSVVIQGDKDLVNYDNLVCADCQTKYEEDLAVGNLNPEDGFTPCRCKICLKLIYVNSEARIEGDYVCGECKSKKKPRRSYTKEGRSTEGLAVMYKCNSCFCNMQLSPDQRDLLNVRGVSGTKIICAACHVKENTPQNRLKNQNRSVQCDICLKDLGKDYVSKDGEEVMCVECRKAEEKERASRMKFVEDPNLRCCTCRKSVSLPFAQYKKLQDMGVRARLKCETCKVKTEQELNKTKTLTSQPEVEFKCDICSMSFGNKFNNFSTHFNNFHLADSLKLEPGRFISCSICSQNFRSSLDLKKHIETHRPNGAVEKGLRKPCSICGDLLTEIPMFNHYKNVHNIVIEKISYDFENVEDFKQWKIDLEKAIDSKFTLRSAQEVVRNNHRCVLISLRCEWNSHKSKVKCMGKGIFCPASIQVYENSDGHCLVDFIETHIGHSDLSVFTASEKLKIEHFLKMKMSTDKIIKALSDDYDTRTPGFHRFSLLKSYDAKSLKRELKKISFCKNESPLQDRTFDEAEDTEESEIEIDYNDIRLPESFAWLKPTQQDNSNSTNRSSPCVVVGVEDDAEFSLKLTVPPEIEARPLGDKKAEILRRFTDTLNKCTTDEHLEVVSLYLSPCDETLGDMMLNCGDVVMEEPQQPCDSLPLLDNEADACSPPKRIKTE